MSDEKMHGKAWRVIRADGSEFAVITVREHFHWYAEGNGISSDATGWPGAAVINLLAKMHASPVEIVPPGGQSAADREAAAFQRGAEAMREAMMLACRLTGDDARARTGALLRAKLAKLPVPADEEKP